MNKQAAIILFNAITLVGEALHHQINKDYYKALDCVDELMKLQKQVFDLPEDKTYVKTEYENCSKCGCDGDLYDFATGTTVTCSFCKGTGRQIKYITEIKE